MSIFFLLINSSKVSFSGAGSENHELLSQKIFKGDVNSECMLHFLHRFAPEGEKNARILDPTPSSSFS